jgi:hypothetical protein
VILEKIKPVENAENARIGAQESPNDVMNG